MFDFATFVSISRGRFSAVAAFALHQLDTHHVLGHDDSSRMDNTFDTHFISFNVFDVLLQRFDLFGVCFGQQRQLMDVIAVISMGTVLQKGIQKKE